MSNRKRPRGRPSKYPPEFQHDAVAMVLDAGRAIAEVGRAIGVNEGTLGNWVAKARRERSAGVELSSDERSELAELRAEVTQLWMERDLLKRSMAFWVKEYANAERIVTADAGLQLLKDELTVDAVRDALRAVLDDASYRRSAERIQTEIHEMPDARDAVTRIEALTRS
jgi:transposase